MTARIRPTSLLLIYTGGTIGMIRDPETGTLKPFPFENILDEIPELKKVGFHISSYSFSPPIDSSNVKPEVWINVAKIIEENYYRFDGFIVLHGTDTMAYSASALSFMLENLNKPVIFTGSQLPIGSLRTDAKENLVTAIEIASSWNGIEPAVPEVAIFFQSKLYRGNRTTKHNAEEFKAFQSYNYPALAETGVHIRFNFPAILPARHKEPFKAHTMLNVNVAILKLFPGIRPEIFDAFSSIIELRAIVLETYGAGNAPSDEWVLKKIGEIIKKGIFVLSVTQCAQGRVEMGMYQTGIGLEKLGVVSGYDITTEAAVTKLMFLLGRYNEPSRIRSDLNKSLRGEITK